MKKIAVLASGGGTNFQALIDGCKGGMINGQIVLLIYNRKEAYAKKRAEIEGIDHVYINRIACGSMEKMQSEVYKNLCKVDADIIVLAGYLEKLNQQTVEKWENKIVNTHPSLIPKFCGQGFYGRKVHQAVIDNGEKESGCTIHLVDANYDTGPVIMQKIVTVNKGDTAELLSERILPYEHELLVKAVSLMCEDLIIVDNGRVIII